MCQGTGFLFGERLPANTLAFLQVLWDQSKHSPSLAELSRPPSLSLPIICETRPQTPAPPSPSPPGRGQVRSGARPPRTSTCAAGRARRCFPVLDCSPELSRLLESPEAVPSPTHSVCCRISDRFRLRWQNWKAFHFAVIAGDRK